MSRPAGMGGIPTPNTFNPYLPSSRAGSNPPSNASSPSRNNGIPVSRTTTLNPDKNISPAPTLSPGGPSQKSPEMVRSEWGIGWQTPSLMLSFYLLALVIALAHLFLFRSIHGRPATGPNAAISQTWVSTLSNILANAFGFSIRASLAIAFAQYLWHLLRVQTMKVSTIELLFSIRNNPFQLLQIAVLRAAPVLCALAVLMWGTQVATGFPPGALNVVAAQQLGWKNVGVPTFDASFMGNGSGFEAAANSLITLDPVASGTGFITGDSTSQGKSRGLLYRLARQVLISGEEFAMPSPCGANCSYSLTFEAPYVTCNSTSNPVVLPSGTSLLNIYKGELSLPAPGHLNGGFTNSTYTLARFSARTLTPISMDKGLPNATNTDLYKLTTQENQTVCTPGRARYTIHHVYENNIPSKNVTVEPISPLINLVLQTHDSVVLVPGFQPNGTFAYGSQPANWSAAALNYYRDNNHMSIFDSMMSWLNGTFEATIDTEYNPSDLLKRPLVYIMSWRELLQSSSSGVTVSNGAQNKTIIDSTRFNSAFGQFSDTTNSETSHNASSPLFTITEASLNSALLNITTSIMASYGRWNTSVNATFSTPITVYAFSQPLNLIIPYFLTLALALPFLALGGWALMRNGVSALDGGFLQTVMTSTGSAALDRAAAGGCLGGHESVPKELKELRVRFGEIINREEPGMVRRAAFGVETEITDLKKGFDYGIARWI